MFNIYYKKNKNKNLFSNLEKHSITKLQNYIPLYQNFFSLNKNNYNNINLNHKYHISNIKSNVEKNKYNIIVKDISDNKFKKKSFFKFSPLLDPIKYMVGKYKDISINELPLFNESKCHKKLLDNNNTAYVDSFFSYLSSQLLNNHHFLNGIDFYGSFIGIQREFNANIFEDIDYIYPSDFFHNNKNVLFSLENFDIDLLEDDTRKYRKRLRLQSHDNIEISLECDKLDETLLNKPFSLTEENINKHNAFLNSNLIYENLEIKFNESSKNSTDSNCSSRSSDTNTSNDEDNENEDDENEDDENEDDENEDNKKDDNSIVSCSNSDMSEYSSDMSDKEVLANVKNFPVQIICMESLHNTLDSFLEGDSKPLNVKEWISCLAQIIFTLITYQKSFAFTHNDLHTNNIMYELTDKKFLYYKYNNKYYKVPTYGRIYKIIDFGRAIYSFKGKLMCSDSFKQSGDAATQYNFKPYFNPNKPQLNPNPSFDLCRLSCSLFDYFITDLDELEDVIKKNPIAKIIVKWCLDDKNRNILYKTNGEERYPDFKLYKMIARTVNNHIPKNEINNDFFKSLITSRKKINKKTKIINIDSINVYI